MKNLIVVLFCMISITAFAEGKGKVITQFDNPGQKKVALTFDACESKTASYFDTSILNYIINNRIPVSIFLSGKFAKRNAKMIKEISQKYPFIAFENHSLSHINHMERLKDKKVISEVMENEKLITSITGRKPKYFRFPAGNYNQRDLELVNKTGLKVVHWTYASGDPDKKVTANALEKEIGTKTRPGNILIFHINGRGWNTGKALPEIVKILGAKGYEFAKLEEVL
jgi:peptidoglycan/xylan/chitin deacetylase (PgdA/CDA1 family)